MAGYVERRWEGSPSAYGGRRARRSFVYRAFVPDRIADLDPRISFETSQLVLGAEDAVAKLNEATSVTGLEAVGPLLLRSEAVASSRIEKIAVSQLDLARALLDPGSARGTARLVAANVLAMDRAIAIGDRAGPLTVADVAEIHGVLLTPDDPAHAGRIRDQQNWIGGRLNSPLDAVYIPPPPEEVPQLLEDLVAFLNRDDLPAVAQAAIAHAQFETIHPFVDGNGRVGRCLIHLILRRRGVAPRFVPPISIVLAARPSSYVAGLTGFREGRLEAWVSSFAGATAAAASASQRFAMEVRALEDAWFERAGRPRRDGAAARIIRLLPAQPIINGATARAALGTSYEAVRVGLLSLAGAGVIRQISGGTYDRIYAADELFELIRRYEERVGAPPQA